MRRLAVALLVALIALCMAAGVPSPAYACRDYDGHRNSVVSPSCGGGEATAYGGGGETIHDVVASTWPAALVPSAEQIAYHEGGGIFSDGYCSFGIIESTQAIYGVDASALDPYACSTLAYQIYQDAGWGAWTTYGSYVPGAENTLITY